MVSPSAPLRPLLTATEAFLSKFMKGLVEPAAGYRPESPGPGPQGDHRAQAMGGAVYGPLSRTFFLIFASALLEVPTHGF